MKKRFERPLLLAVLAAASSAPALAQDQADTGVEDIVVTAQKREESLQDTPISIVALTASDLEKKGVSGLVDLRSQVPNLQLTPHPNSGSTTQIFMRGVGLNDDQITQDPSVAVYMDGVYVARSQGMALEVADLARVEVLRGPQGTLYGRNATGGAINFITAKPKLGEFGAKAQLSLGNYDLRRFKVGVNVPVGDRLAVNLAFVKMKQDGFIDNPGTVASRWGNKDRVAMRADVLWEPTDSLELRYAYDRSDVDDSPSFISLTPLYPATIDRPKAGSPLVRDLLKNNVVSQGHSLIAEWKASDNLTIRSIGAYRKLSNFQNQDYLSGVNGPFPLQKTSSQTNQDQWSEELQLVGDGLDGALEYVAGVYYFSESGNAASESLNGVTRVTGRGNSTIDNSAWALFGQATVTPRWLDSRLHFTFGARQSWDHRRATRVRSNQTGAGPIVPVPGVADGDRKFNDFSPSFVIAFDAAEHVNIYAKVVKGYKSGGYNIRASSPAAFNAGFDPETLWSYEAGVKSQFWDNKVRLNAAAFLSKYKDIQVNVQSDPTNIRITDVFNAGKATVKGFEGELTLAPVRGLRLTANYGYLDARYDEIIDIGGNDIADTFRFLNSPKHSYGLDLDYSLPPMAFGTLDANVGYSWQSRKYTASSIAGGAYIIGSYGLLNARLTLADMPFAKGVKLSLWGRNLTDKDYYVAHFNVGRPGAIFGEPRSYGVDLAFEF
jgi:iron complex outermembrane receptor protein